MDGWLDGLIDWLIDCIFLQHVFNGQWLLHLWGLFCLLWSGHRFLGKFHFPNWQVILQPRSDCIIKCPQTPWPLWGRWFPAARRVHTKQAFMPLLPCQFSFNCNKQIIKIQNSKLKANKGRRRSDGQDTANLIAEMSLGGLGVQIPSDTFSYTKFCPHEWMVRIRCVIFRYSFREVRNLRCFYFPET